MSSIVGSFWGISLFVSRATLVPLAGLIRVLLETELTITTPPPVIKPLAGAAKQLDDGIGNTLVSINPQAAFAPASQRTKLSSAKLASHAALVCNLGAKPTPKHNGHLRATWPILVPGSARDKGLGSEFNRIVRSHSKGEIQWRI
jgi:hypothetical protein